jgi:SAM-dependent methyltransferase
VDDHSAWLRRFYDAEMQDRAGRPLGSARERLVDDFGRLLRAEHRSQLLEVGCGAGRDGLRLAGPGISYTGVDLSAAAVRVCRDLGLAAVEASATALPFADDAFDAAWSMSTLMHLVDDGFGEAVQELARVLRSGGIVEIGVWGHAETREWISPDGRFFNQRSDQELLRELRSLGEVEAFQTWGRDDGGGHYQWARVRT